MKKINIYFIGFVFLATALGGSIPIFAVEEASTMMCDEGVVKIGDTDADVREKCGEPNSQSMDKWIYECHPSAVVFRFEYPTPGSRDSF